VNNISQNDKNFKEFLIEAFPYFDRKNKRNWVNKKHNCNSYINGKWGRRTRVEEEMIMTE
jgi:hypothetical protein